MRGLGGWSGRRAAAWLAGAAILVGAGAWFHPDVDGSDLWWHLATGRQLWEQGEVPRTETFSYTAEGQPWIHHEWLWGGLLWPVYERDPDLVAWVQVALLFVLFGLVAWNAWQATRSWLVAGAAT